MKAYIKYPNQHFEEADIENTLEAFQDIVGGYIEVVYLSNDVVMVINEEGKIDGLIPNFVFRDDVIVGPAVFVGTYGEDFTDAPELKEIIDLLLR